MTYFRQNSITITILFISFLYLRGNSADTTSVIINSDQFKIKFIGHISKTEDIIKSDSFFGKFWDIIAGNEEQSLIKPFSVLSTMSGKMFVLDQGACKIQLYNQKDNSAATYHFPGMVSLVDMAMLKDSSLIFSDSREMQVYKLDPDEDEPLVFTNNHILNQPTGLACNPVTGNVWIAETAAHRLSIFDPHGNFIRHIGTRGSEKGQFNYPTFISIDQNQNVYVVDTMNGRIQIFDHQGNILSVFGQTGDGSGDLARPKGITSDSFGHIYIVDGIFHNVQVFDRQGKFLTHFGTQGQAAGQFWMPTGIFIDSNDRIYVADTYNSRIQIFELEAAN